MLYKKLLVWGGGFLCGIVVLFFVATRVNTNPFRSVGSVVDNFNNVAVYHNGGMNYVEGRNVVDGYNIGLRYQCVEFVKRYYYERFHHKMSNSYGHAKDFFNKKLASGTLNTERGLLQFTNGSTTKPQVEDIVIFDGTLMNRYGHVAIITKVNDDSIEVIQQNTWQSRETIVLTANNGSWTIKGYNVLGFLRRP